MKLCIHLLAAACCLIIADSASHAAMLNYGFTGTLTEVSSFGAPAVPGGKIVGTISLDNSAPPTSSDPIASTYGDPSLNMTGTLDVLGTPYSFNYPIPVNDTFRIFNGNFQPRNDGFYISRIGPEGDDTRLEIALEFLPPVTTGHTGLLSDFNVNYPTLPQGATGTFVLRLPTDGIPVRVFRGTINSFVPIPEPSTLALATIGGLALLAYAKRRRSV